jgi:hypothetical protein
MFHNQEQLPYVFDSVEYKYLDKGSLHAHAFYSIAMLWKAERTITKVTIDVNSTGRTGIDDHEWQGYLNSLDDTPEITTEECVEFIIHQFTKQELKRKSEILYNITNSKDLDFDKLVIAAEDIIGTVNASSIEDPSRDDIFAEESFLEFNNQMLKERFQLYRQNLTFIAGAAGNMKTSLACFMENDLLEAGYKVLHFPVDSNYKETIANLISMRRRINRKLILSHSKKNPQLRPEEFEVVQEEHKLIKSKFIEPGLLIIDDKACSLPEINLRIRTAKPDLAIIDLINSIVLPGVEKGDTTEAFYTPIIVNRLKQISKQMDCAILGLLWMHTTKRRPEITDLYGSKAAEKWANKVWMAYYAYQYELIPTFEDIFEVKDGKTRYGKNEIYPLKVTPAYCTFSFSDHDKLIQKQYKNLTKMPEHMLWRGKKP